MILQCKFGVPRLLRLIDVIVGEPAIQEVGCGAPSVSEGFSDVVAAEIDTAHAR